MRTKCAYWACDRMIETKGTTRKYCSERCKELTKRERVNAQSVKKEADFDCEHCKHLKPSNKTNRLFCSYHSEGEHQYEVFKDEYCSYFERAESSKKDNCISEGEGFSCGHSAEKEGEA